MLPNQTPSDQNTCSALNESMLFSLWLYLDTSRSLSSARVSRSHAPSLSLSLSLSQTLESQPQVHRLKP